MNGYEDNKYMQEEESESEAEPEEEAAALDPMKLYVYLKEKRN